MPRLPKKPGAPRAHSFLFVGVALLLTLGGGLLLIQSGAIEALNSSGLLAEQSSAP